MRLLVVNDFGIQGGGTENRVRLLLDEFLRRRYVSSVDILQSAGRPVPQDDTMRVTQTCGGVRETYRLTRRIIREKKIDIVQAHNMLSVTPSVVAAAHRANVPVVWFAHDYWPLCAHRSFVDAFRAREKQTCSHANFRACLPCCGARARLRLWIFRRMMRTVESAIASAECVRRVYEDHGFLRGTWSVIAPWIDTSVFHGGDAHSRQPIVVFTGSLIDYKGAWVLAHAAKLIRAQVPAARFIFIGGSGREEAPYRKDIENIFREGGVSEGAEFREYASWRELAGVYRKAGVYVCPTVCMETFGLNWAEAMACGTPVVASQIGSLPEFLENKAVLVPPRSPEKLAEGVIRVLKDKALAEKLGSEGIQYCAQRFNVSTAAEKIIARYEAVRARRSH
jgi:glycosyltransferase involved in cell wall biosynthesis